MIIITKDEHKHVDAWDLADLLKDNEILLRGIEDDAKNAVRVLGTANVTYRKVVWRRNEKHITPYTDYILTLK